MAKAEQAAGDKGEEEKLTLRAHTPKAREVTNAEREIARDNNAWLR